MKLKNTLLQLN